MRARLKKKLARRLENPFIESALLRGELAGLYVIRSHSDGLRLVYAASDEDRSILVLSVGRREDLTAYKLAMARR
jgi:mRNA interferase RelE/StbE